MMLWNWIWCHHFFFRFENVDIAIIVEKNKPIYEHFFLNKCFFDEHEHTNRRYAKNNECIWVFCWSCQIRKYQPEMIDENNPLSRSYQRSTSNGIERGKTKDVPIITIIGDVNANVYILSISFHSLYTSNSVSPTCKLIFDQIMTQIFYRLFKSIR